MPSLTSTEPALRTYWLETVPLSEPSGARVRMAVVPGLDTQRIWLLEQDQRLNYYAGAEWQARLESLLESVVERSLRAPGAPADGGAYQVELERFFAVARGAELAPLVEIRARIAPVNGAWLCGYEARTPADSDRLRDIVAAHQELLDGLVREINRLAAEPVPRCSGSGPG